jgi:peptidoglycan/LPS O-acetylase OafA/YrhL
MTRIERSRRLDYLDSLRGIAAVLVLVHHVYQTSPIYAEFVRYTPARIFLNGRPNVLFFFVLSGFVLAYGLWRGAQGNSYLIYLLRRFARIYIPYAVVGLIAAVLMLLIPTGMLASAAITFNSMWQFPISWNTGLEHLVLVGSNVSNSVNAPGWSLVYELRVSALIPLFCYLIHTNLRNFLVVYSAIFVAGEVLAGYYGISGAASQAQGLAGNILLTLHFSGVFVAGILLAKLFLDRPESLHNLSLGVRIALVPIAIALMLVFRDLTNTLGAVAIMVLALSSPPFQRALRMPVLLWLGKISFSLYLTHMVVLEAVVRLLDGHLSLGFSILLAIPIMFVVAYAVFQFVERPAHLLSIRLGRLSVPVPAAS